MRLPAAPPGRWREQAKLVDLAGAIAVDNDTGVMLQAEVDGRLEIRAEAARPTMLTLHHAHVITEAGRAGNVRAPSRVTAEFRRPLRQRDPLAFFRDQLAGTPPPPGATQGGEDDASARPGAPPPTNED